MKRGVSKYVWLANEIRSFIEQGNLPDNRMLPGERELSERYSLSRDTVRKTIRLLEDEGVVYSDHGRGTFAAPLAARRTTRTLGGFSDEVAARGGVAGQRLLLVEPEPAPAALTGRLGIPAGTPVTRVRRVLFVDRQPVALHDARIIVGRGQSLDRAKLERLGSLYALLRLQGIVPAIAVDKLNAEAAAADEAELLQVASCSPLLRCERATFSARREPIEHCVMKYVPSFRFTTWCSEMPQFPGWP